MTAMLFALLCAAASLGLVPDECRTDAGTPDIDPVDDVPAAATCVAPFLLPKIVADVHRLREYVRGEDFRLLRSMRGDVRATDAIYRRAFRLSWNNSHVALLVAFAACLEHRRVGVRLPGLGAVLWFPLTSEFTDDFSARVISLPSHLYPDTPPEGDRDKLQHFFGSAFLAALCESGDAAVRAGEFVEWGEDLFIVGGTLDERDLRANRQGILFGLRVLDSPSTLPSEFLRVPLSPRPSPFLTVEPAQLGIELEIP